ncbi:MAG: ABC transporter ATP-binding protein [Burkholderiales bacterium]
MSIRLESLTKKFGEQVLFDNITLEFPLNETTVIAGPSGCGKTTLLRILAGLDKDYTGNVTGVPRKISFMFQEDRLLPWQSVKGNIEFVLKDIMGKDEMDAVTRDIIEAMQLTGHEDKTPSKLSGGMKRRVAMARAYCYPAELYLLDEPFKGFDSKLLSDMISLFRRLFIERKKSVILVTHDEAVISELGQNLIDISGLCRIGGR